MSDDPARWCCVCLFNGGVQTEAATVVKGYRVCVPHLSLTEDFFRTWETTQDPKQPKRAKKKRKDKG